MTHSATILSGPRAPPHASLHSPDNQKSILSHSWREIQRHIDELDEDITGFYHNNKKLGDQS